MQLLHLKLEDGSIFADGFSMNVNITIIINNNDLTEVSLQQSSHAIVCYNVTQGLNIISELTGRVFMFLPQLHTTTLNMANSRTNCLAVYQR